MNNIRKLRVIEMEKNGTEEVLEVKETVKVKTKWSLKKKLIIGGAALAGLVLGALALVHKQKELLAEEEMEEVNDDEEVIDDVEETEEVEAVVEEPIQDSGV